jgi:hypothetical protein
MVRVAAAAAVCAVAAILTGLLIGPAGGIEGVEFDPRLNDPNDTPVVAGGGAGLLDPSDGNLWLGAGIAFAILALVLLVAVRRSSR